MIESLLREEGFKTGLFTSPHLCKVNERIRINGAPISDDDFAPSFHHIYDQLDDHHRPAYFSFLTLVAFHAFTTLKVDVIILEVGIGGTFCATSLFPVGQAKRVCCVTGKFRISSNVFTNSVVLTVKVGKSVRAFGFLANF